MNRLVSLSASLLSTTLKLSPNLFDRVYYFLSRKASAWALCFLAGFVLDKPLRAQFAEVSENAGISHLTIDPTLLSGGVAFFDYQNDGFEDIFLIGGDRPNKLYENQGNGNFTDVSDRVGLHKIDHIRTMGISCGDLDNDGYKDLLITSIDQEGIYLLWNMNGMYFEEGSKDANISAAFYSSSSAFGDYNQDSYLDIYIGNYNSGMPGDLLLKNNGDRTFSDQSHLLGNHHGGTALAVAFSDYDADHDVDILVGNDFGDLYQPNRLFANQFPQIGFKELSENKGWDIRINSMGIAIGDYDEDGDLDYYVSDIGDNYLFANQQGHTFVKQAHETGVDNSESTSWGTAFLDFDNNSFLDLFVSNGLFEVGSRKQENKLYRGNGRSFEDVSAIQQVASSFRSRGLAVGDYNNDGHQDLLVGVVFNRPHAGYHTLLYKNPGNENNWVKFTLKGTNSNCDAIGSLVRIYFEGRSLVRELSGGSSYLSQNSHIIHFGVGITNSLDSVLVTWPNADQEVFRNLETNQQYEIVERGGIYRTTASVATVRNDEGLFFQDQWRYTEGVYVDTIHFESQIDEIVKTKLVINEAEPFVTSIDTNPKFHIWPNPFEQQINIADQSINTGHPVEVTVYDLLGQVVYRKERTFKSNTTIDFGPLKLTRGVYVIQLNDGRLYKKSLFKK